MQKKPRKQFLSSKSRKPDSRFDERGSDSPKKFLQSKSEFKKDASNLFPKKSGSGGYSRSDRDGLDSRRDDRQNSEPLYSTAGKKRFFRNEEPKPFRRGKDVSAKFPPRKKDSGDYQNRDEGFSRREEPKPFRGRKDVSAKFPPRRDDSGERPQRSFSDYRNRDKGFSRREEPKPFREKKDFRSGKKSFQKKNNARKSETVDKPLFTEPFRLNKYLAHAGIASRRESDEIIKEGFVTVNGVVVTEMGHKVQPGDVVKFKDRILSPEKKVYILLNKPKDFITTVNDERGRPTVMSLIENATDMRIYPVGRLDRKTTGLLLLTNDGELAQKLTHPSFEAKKVYLATLDKPLHKEDMKHIADGVKLEEGVAMVDAVEYADPRDKSKIGIELHIGWNKVVRRIFEQLGYEVTQLDRVYYAGLTKDVPRGKWRMLTPKEVIMLKHFT